MVGVVCDRSLSLSAEAYTTFDIDTNKGNVDSSSVSDERNDSEPDEDDRDTWLHPPVKYVYDAAAERTQQRLREATAALMVNGVH
jgi:hypothetical protein